MTALNHFKVCLCTLAVFLCHMFPELVSLAIRPNCGDH